MPKAGLSGKHKRQVRSVADISKEIQDFKTAVYGEDVRDSMVSLAEKVNAEAENNTQKVNQYGQAESQRVAAESQRVTAENQRKAAETSRVQEFKTLKQESEDATEAANTAAQNANAKAVLAASATEAATGAASAANAAAGSVDAVKQAAQEATEAANMAASTANNKATLANTAAGSANEAADRANEAAERAEGVVLDDISAFTVTFQEALERANIQSGDSLATAFGKLAKFCADMQDYVFSAPIDNLLSTDSTRPLAASMGKRLNDDLSASLLYEPRYDDLVDGSSFNKDFLAIYLPGHKNKLNAAEYFSKPANDSEWSNIPAEMSGKLWLGYRVPQRMTSTNELVVITEHYPVAGRIWINYYNSGNWQGWRNITPEYMVSGNFTGNMNDLKSPGWYWCIFANITNGPYTSGYGWLEVITSSTTAVVQKVYRYNASGITQVTMRGYTNAQWYPWRTLQTVEFTPA